MKNGVPTKGRTGLVAALDVGSSKVCCLIARARGDQPPRVVGVGHHVSRGLRNGTLVDLEGAEGAVRATVEAAEQMAGETIRRVVVNLSGGAPDSRLSAFEVSVAGHQIADADLRRILDPADLIRTLPEDRNLIHALPVGYAIDGHRGVRDPRGLFGERLGVNLHVVTAAQGAVRNLATLIARCDLEIDTRVLSPYASAQAVLVEDEAQLGATCIDMGGGTTSVAVVFDGEVVHTDILPVGGNHVTSDIARGLSTPLAHAERMKTLYGSVIPSPSDDVEVIKVPLMGEDAGAEATPVPRSMLVGIIRPRLEEIFEMVRARLEAAGFDRAAGRHVVLTGGASQLPGVPELAGQILEKQVRLARPRPMDGLAEAAGGPAFATCVGLLRFAFNQPAESVQNAPRHDREPSGRLARLGQWIRDNF